MASERSKRRDFLVCIFITKVLSHMKKMIECKCFLLQLGIVALNSFALSDYKFIEELP